MKQFHVDVNALFAPEHRRLGRTLRRAGKQESAEWVRTRVNGAVSEFLFNTANQTEMQEHARKYFDVAHAAIKHGVPADQAVQETQVLMAKRAYIAPIVFALAKAAITKGGLHSINILREMQERISGKPLQSEKILRAETTQLRRARNKRA